MKIKILAFGIVKDIFGSPSITMEIEKNEIKVVALKKILESKYKDLKALASYLVAINNNYASLNDTIKEKDEVAVIPPVSGG